VRTGSKEEVLVGKGFGDRKEKVLEEVTELDYRSHTRMEEVHRKEDRGEASIRKLLGEEVHRNDSREGERSFRKDSKEEGERRIPSLT